MALLIDDRLKAGSRERDPDFRPDRVARLVKDRNEIDYRKDVGAPLTDMQYQAWLRAKQAAAEAKSKYLSESEQRITEAEQQARSRFRPPDTSVKINAQPLKEVIVLAGGDGDKPTAYRLPAENAKSILDNLVQASKGYYHYVQHNPTTYGLAFGEYGKEGYEYMNEAQRQWNDAKKRREQEIAKVRGEAAKRAEQMKARAAGAFNENLQKEIEAARKISKMEAGRFDQQINRLRSDVAERYQLRLKGNEELFRSLIDKGVLKKKASLK